MNKITNTVKFGLMFRDKDTTISTAPNIKAYEKIELKSTKPIVFAVIKNLESDGLLFYGDQIVAIKNKKIENMYDFYIEKNKLKWNSSFNFKVLRDKKLLNIKIQLKSLNNWKKSYPRIGIDVVFKRNKIKISEVSFLSSALPKWNSDTKVKTGDHIISINGQKISNLRDFAKEVENCVPNKKINISISRPELKKFLIKIISYEDFLKLNREFCFHHWPKKAAEILVKEYEANDYFLDEKYKLKVAIDNINPGYHKQLSRTVKTGIGKGRFKLTPKGKIKASRKNKTAKFYT